MAPDLKGALLQREAVCGGGLGRVLAPPTFYVGAETKRLETCATCDDPGIFVVGQPYRADLGTWVCRRPG